MALGIKTILLLVMFTFTLHDFVVEQSDTLNLYEKIQTSQKSSPCGHNVLAHAIFHLPMLLNTAELFIEPLVVQRDIYDFETIVLQHQNTTPFTPPRTI
ncbi:hypothetical protein JHD47_04665 [Sulfurimonas sp. SAG-AH-194-L11]|nr:hypothetical protein [Sulfurimonas sp. SAG-AH-194-L11]